MTPDPMGARLMLLSTTASELERIINHGSHVDAVRKLDAVLARASEVGKDLGPLPEPDFIDHGTSDSGRAAIIAMNFRWAAIRFRDDRPGDFVLAVSQALVLRGQWDGTIPVVPNWIKDNQ